jgi:hypothetical protein
MPLTLIPSYPDLPMEKVYPREPRTNIGQVFLREVPGESAIGANSARPAGRVVYFPGDLDRTFWEVLCVDHGILLRNAIEWATGEEPFVRVEGPGLLDVTVWRQKQSLTVHLVNLTNPMMMKGPVRELIPAGEQTVRLRLPDGARPRSVKLLVSDRSARAQRTGQIVTVKVPAILDHEVVAVDL